MALLLGSCQELLQVSSEVATKTLQVGTGQRAPAAAGLQYTRCCMCTQQASPCCAPYTCPTSI